MKLGMKVALMGAVGVLAMPAWPAAAQWTAARSMTPDTKISQCVMGSKQGNQEVRLLKFGDDDQYYVHVVIRDLDRSDSTRYPVRVVFDDARTWDLNAVIAHGDGGLVANMRASDFVFFLADLRGSNKMWLNLTSVGYNDWRMTLSGSMASGDEFLGCVQKLSAARQSR